MQDCLYGGTRDFITQDLVSFGITHEFIRGDDPDSWEAKMQSNTRAIYVETMTNPLLHVADLEAVVDFAQSHGITSLIDNTFASPINFRPAELGFDLSIHSGTKYLNGHSDILAGAVIGSGQLIEKIRHVLNHLGGSLSPHSCFLLHRGLKTLAVRMQYQNASGLRIARFLQDHTYVERVNYAGLEEQSDHERARSLLDGFSGMLSFDPNGDGEIAERIIREARLPIVAPSLGGVESLITIPATTSHAGVSPHVRQELGISDSLIRLSVGLEATDDIIEDLDYAIRAVM